MTHEILIATGNKGKRAELMEVFSLLTPEIEFKFPQDFPPFDEPEEHGTTFQENALLKAQHFGDQFQLPTLGEDSGLILDAFPQKFGVKTRREINANSDEDWLAQFLSMLENEDNRTATFYSAIAWYDPVTQNSRTFLGSTTGQITHEPQAPLEHGIPVSAVFVPEGKEIVYSAMDKHEKNAVSHRGKSSHLMVDFLREQYQ